MTAKAKNAGNDWTPTQVTQLRTQIKQNTPTRVIALKQLRSPSAVQQKANDLGLSTKPANQRPYGTRGKR